MTPKFKLVCQLAISLAIILGFFAYVFALFFLAKNIDPTVRESVTLITGALIATFTGVSAYWLGTSLSSSAKDATISNLTKGPTP
jgi:apolipoprotein N-acyltransferase